MRYFVQALGILFIFVCAASADMLYLKDGTKIQGKVLRKTDFSIVFEYEGVPRTYYQYEYEKLVEGEEPGVSPAVKTQGDQSAVKRDLVLKVMDAIGARENMERSFSDILAKVPAENRAKYEEILKVDDLLDRIIPIYSKYYTENELGEIVTFFRSSTGKKYMQMTPQIVGESLQEALKYFREKSGK